MAGADLAGVLLVVVEVLRRAAAGSRSRSAGTRHDARGLNSTWIFTSFATVTQRAAAPARRAPCCASRERIDVGVVAVALVGELLHRRVLEVAHAEAEHRQDDAACRACPRSGASSSPWSVTPTLKSPSVARITRLTPPLMKCSARHLVGELDARAAVGRAARLEPLDRVEDRRRVARRGVDGSTRPGVAGVDDDRDAVLRAVSVRRQHRQRRFHQRQLVRLDHRAGDVDQEHEVARRRCGSASIRRACRPTRASRCVAFHGHARDLGRHRERRARRAARGSRRGSS